MDFLHSNLNYRYPDHKLHKKRIEAFRSKVIRVELIDISFLSKGAHTHKKVTKNQEFESF